MFYDIIKFVNKKIIYALTIFNKKIMHVLNIFNYINW